MSLRARLEHQIDGCPALRVYTERIGAARAGGWEYEPREPIEILGIRTTMAGMVLDLSEVKGKDTAPLAQWMLQAPPIFWRVETLSRAMEFPTVWAGDQSGRSELWIVDRAGVVFKTAMGELALGGLIVERGNFIGLMLPIDDRDGQQLFLVGMECQRDAILRAMAFMDEPIVSERKVVMVDRASRRRHPEQSFSKVSFVELRRRKSVSKENGQRVETGSNVRAPWSWQWYVAGHKRRMASGVETQVRSYIKGPPDKPLKARVVRVAR